MMQLESKWENLTKSDALFQHLCAEVFPKYFYQCRWFGGKSGNILSVGIDDLVLLSDEYRHYYLLVIEVFFAESFAHHYFLPLAITPDAEQLPEPAKVMPISIEGKNFWLIDAVYHQGFHECLYKNLSGKSHASLEGTIEFRSTVDLQQDVPFESKLLNAEQSNSTIVILDQYFLKVFRRLFRDKNPDFEINEYLSKQDIFTNYPTLAGLISWKLKSGFEISLGLMQQKVENQGDAWNWMLNQISDVFHKKTQHLEKSAPAMLQPLNIADLPRHLQQRPGIDFFESIQTLAQRTAEMHIALAKERKDRSFVPIAYNSDFTVWLKNRLIYQFESRYNLLHKVFDSLPPDAQVMAREIEEQKDFIINFILGFDEEILMSSRIRIHGDYHLGQILIQDEDFYILDFEGEPESTIRDRKVKQSPLKDVAGLFRSFHYAIYATHFAKGNQMPDELTIAHSKELYRCMVGVFMRTYSELAFDQNLDIGYRKEINYLLQYFLLEKAIYELGYELNGRPDWAIIPLKGILEIIQEIKSYEQ